MAVNYKDVIERLEHKPVEQFDFLTVYVACDDFVENINRLLIRLLNDEEALAP